MPKNTIQFQKGLSLHQFLEKYGTDAQCSQALYQLRWPTGYVCPVCGNTTGCELKNRKIYQCYKCHHQTSLTAGTIFHGTKLSMNKWFLAIYLLTQRKKSTSALQLSREIGVNYNTAWKLKHKLMQVMMERQGEKKLAGCIEIDDAYIGGEKPGKRGRGSRNKIPFVAAVETTRPGIRPPTPACHPVGGVHRPRNTAWAEPATCQPGSASYQYPPIALGSGLLHPPTSSVLCL